VHLHLLKVLLVLLEVLLKRSHSVISKQENKGMPLRLFYDLQGSCNPTSRKGKRERKREQERERERESFRVERKMKARDLSGGEESSHIS
jgi:hypothetical protein